MNTDILARENYYLGAYWRNRPLTAEEYLDFARELLQKLHQFDPEAFGCIYSDTDYLNKHHNCYAPDFSDFNERLFPQLEDDLVYENRDPEDQSYNLNAKSPMGFSRSFYAANAPKQKPYVSISIDAGTTYAPQTNVVLIEFPQSDYPQFTDPNYVRDLFKLVVAHCEPETARVISYEISKLTGKKAKEHGGVGSYPVGWFNWVPDPAAESYLPPDTISEHFSNGVIIQLSEEMPSSENKDLISHAISIRDSLNVAGYLRKSA